jgi:dihydrofolate reductase
VRRLKATVEGDINVGGPHLAGRLTELGLIDEYEIYFRPVVLGRGKPYFAGARPPLHLVATTAVGEDGVRLTFASAS